MWSKENKARLILPEFKAFEPKTFKLLKDSGYKIYEPRGWNLDDLKRMGLNYDQEFDPDPQCDSFRLERSINGQIAVHPDALYIPQSELRSLDGQERRELELDDELELSKKYPGVTVEMGRVTDWLSIAYLFSITNNGKPLFSYDRRIRTKSVPNIDQTANIGIKPKQLNPNEWIISVTQSLYFLPNLSIHAAYFLRAI